MQFLPSYFNLAPTVHPPSTVLEDPLTHISRSGEDLENTVGEGRWKISVLWAEKLFLHLAYNEFMEPTNCLCI